MFLPERRVLNVPFASTDPLRGTNPQAGFVVVETRSRGLSRALTWVNEKLIRPESPPKLETSASWDKAPGPC